MFIDARMLTYLNANGKDKPLLSPIPDETLNKARS